MSTGIGGETKGGEMEPQNSRQAPPSVQKETGGGTPDLHFPGGTGRRPGHGPLDPGGRLQGVDRRGGGEGGRGGRGGVPGGLAHGLEGAGVPPAAAAVHRGRGLPVGGGGGRGTS